MRTERRDRAAGIAEPIEVDGGTLKQRLASLAMMRRVRNPAPLALI
jgi:hypothetical protein